MPMNKKQVRKSLVVLGHPRRAFDAQHPAPAYQPLITRLFRAYGSRRARQSETGGMPYTQETGEEAAPLERRRGSKRHGERWHAP